ncbi:MAG: ATP-dependent DNA helicase [Methanomassiliicoccales archaeon]|nr:ATP-dependent DNA helicase [Methanomassiliicoccales archaeon]
MDLFPYRPRPGQREIVEDIVAAVRNKQHIIIESGTGSGKTICALVGCLSASLDTGKKILYLTRTNSQQQQVLKELRRINGIRPVYGLGLQGRQSTCPLARRDPELRSGTPEELSRLCAEKKRRTVDELEGGCRFYEETIATPFDEIERYVFSEIPTVEEFVDYCDGRGICPYELAKELASKAVVVTAPYAYFFVQFIRDALLDWMSVPISDLVVVVDEAHNLLDYAREVRTLNLSRKSLRHVEREVDEFGDLEILDGVSILDIVSVMHEALDSAVEEYLLDEDGLLPTNFLEERLLHAFTLTSKMLELATRELMVQGEIIRERKKEAGRLPRSYIFSLGAFLNFWMNIEERYYVKLILGGDNPSFESYCLDPSIACAPLLECAATVHMSGTLSPLNEYRDSIGLPLNSPMKSFPSPFPKRNRKILFVDDVTTKYEDLAQDQEIVEKIEDYIVNICNGVRRNTVVFFPSFNLLQRLLSNGILYRIKRKVHVEERGMSQSELMETVTRFREGAEQGAVLFAVVGGRVSEGLDFPDRELELAFVVGIPYPKPTAKQRALLHYYEMKFGRGWEYTVRAPAYRRMLQAIGRLIRTDTDIGVAIILDRRARQFSDRIELELTQDPLGDVLRFFEEREKERRVSTEATKMRKVDTKSSG